MPINNYCDFINLYVQNRAEHEWLEYKLNNSDPEMIGRTISALANAAFILGKPRAFFVFGVDDQTQQLVGTSVKLKTSKKGNQDLQQWLEQMIQPQLALEFHDFECDGKSFSIIEIHANLNRPVAFSGTEYIRINSVVKNLRDFPEHERKIWKAAEQAVFEQAIAKFHITLDEVKSRLDLKTYFELLNIPGPSSDTELERHLLANNIIKENLEGRFDLTNLGAVLLAKDLSDFKELSAKKIRLVAHKGRDKTQVILDQEFSSGYAIALQQALAKCIHHVPGREVYENGTRRMLEIPPNAIREVLANALIHQDFLLRGSTPMIELFEDRLEITNPGKPLIETRRMIDDRRSRNEALARTMRDLHLCEERGGGLDKAIHESETAYLPAPDLIASDTTMRVILKGPKEFSEMNKQERIWSTYCHCAIRYVASQPMNNTTLRERFGMGKEDYQAISLLIKETIHEGLIAPADPEQGKRNARYIPYFAVSSG